MARPPVLKAGDALLTGEPGSGPNAAHPERSLRCPLCGGEFAADSVACHAGCPIAGHCRVLCCPHCGYEFPDEEATRRRLRRLRDSLRSVFRRRP